jgi:hypothetical protein
VEPFVEPSVESTLASPAASPTLGPYSLPVQVETVAPPAYQSADNVQRAFAAEAASGSDQPPFFANHPQPLQDVWNVERRAGGDYREGDATSSGRPASSPGASGDMLPAAEREATSAALARTLDSVESSAPTASRIEMVTPRRSRAAVAAALRAPEDLTPATRASLPAPDAETTARGTPATAAPAFAGEPPLIHTDIGPLPADLWQFLDQTPPESTVPLQPRPSAQTQPPSQQGAGDTGATPNEPPPSTQTQPRSQAPLQAPSQTLQALPAGTWPTPAWPQPLAPHPEPRILPDTHDAAVTAVQPAQPQAVRSLPAAPTRPHPTPPEAAPAPMTTIQLSPAATPPDAIPATASNASAPPVSAPGSPPPSAPAAPEIDVEELARQVYARLRQRLLLEWERISKR